MCSLDLPYPALRLSPQSTLLLAHLCTLLHCLLQHSSRYLQYFLVQKFHSNLFHSQPSMDGVGGWSRTAGLMARLHCTRAGPGTMGYYILCRTVHTAPGRGIGPDPLSSIVPVQLPVPVPFARSVNVSLAFRFYKFKVLFRIGINSSWLMLMLPCSQRLPL